MDIERLKELKDYLRVANELSVLNDDNLMQRIVESNDVTNTIDIAIELLNAEIARQSEIEKVVCPDCGGSGVYQEYDEYDRYYVHACGTCEGTGEIARQSVKSEDVQEAIDMLQVIRPNERFLELCKQYGFAVQQDSQSPGIFLRQKDGTLSEVTCFTPENEGSK